MFHEHGSLSLLLAKWRKKLTWRSKTLWAFSSNGTSGQCYYQMTDAKKEATLLLHSNIYPGEYFPNNGQIITLAGSTVSTAAEFRVLLP